MLAFVVSTNEITYSYIEIELAELLDLDDYTLTNTNDLLYS
jgi:hypothetical protein